MTHVARGGTEAILVPVGIAREMVEHARRDAPKECCGLLAGCGAAVHSIYPLTNESERADEEFFVGPGLVAPFRTMRERKEELIGIYHSHPTSRAVPSQKDLERNYYPEAVHFIVSLAGASPQIEAYRLSAAGYEPATWRTIG
jgi:proteasome lid subunit RPN8/RPN11